MSVGVMRHVPSGEVYVMEINDDREGTVAWVAGPFALDEIAGAEDLRDFAQAADAEDAAWAEAQEWIVVS